VKLLIKPVIDLALSELFTDITMKRRLTGRKSTGSMWKEHGYAWSLCAWRSFI